MIKVKLEANEVELALNVAAKRYIGNLRMGKTFSYGYTKGIKSQLTDGILGALGEVVYAKATNSFLAALRISALFFFRISPTSFFLFSMTITKFS